MSLLFNPTPVEMVGRWDGSNYKIPAEGSVELPERVAAHILNHLSPRGLVELKHGDKKGTKGKEGLDTWEEFERRQILEFRQINENRKSAGFPPLTPSKMLLEMVRRTEGDESAERLEYASAETATMLLQQMVKGQTEGSGDIAEAVTTLTNAMAQMMANQQQDRETMIALVGKLAEKPDKEE